jgi:hypothetical protein
MSVNWENLAIAALVSVAMIVSYLWGYRDGIKYCVRQMQPLGDMAKQIAEALDKNRRKP